MDGIDVRYLRTPLPAALARRGITRETVFAGVAATGAALSRADAIVSYHYADVWGASLVRRSRPVALKLTGAVPLDYMREHGSAADAALLRRALDTAAQVWVNSRYAADAMAGWGREMQVLPAGLDTDLFSPSCERASEPLVLCTAAPEEPRKRLADLLDAWASVLELMPGARLVVAGAASRAVQEALLALVPVEHRPSVRFAGRLDDAALVDAYSRAWVTVAPAVHEALGLATLESLSCGTPVAGARSGATPELLAEAGTGLLFEPGDPASLAQAVLAAAELGLQPGGRDRCRARAQRWAWPAILDELEQRLHVLVDPSRAAPAPP